MSVTFPVALHEPLLEGDVSVSGFYPIDAPLESVVTVFGTGTEDHWGADDLGRIVPGSLAFLVDGTSDSDHGLTGYYYNDVGALLDFDQTQFLVSRIDPNPNTIYVSGLVRPPAIPGGGDFEVRWIGELIAPITDDYTFTVSSDGTSTMWLDGVNVITLGAGSQSSSPIHLTAGVHDIQIDYVNAGTAGVLNVQWQYTLQVTAADVPTTNFVPIDHYHDLPTDVYVGDLVLNATGAVVGSIDYFSGVWALITPTGHIPPFHYAVTTTLTPIPAVAVLADGVKLGEAFVEVTGAVTNDVLYDDGTTHDSWSWTFDIASTYGTTYRFTGDGSNDDFAGSPGKHIISGTFRVVIDPTGEAYHDFALDANTGRIYNVSDVIVGEINYAAGTWAFTTLAGHTPPNLSTINVTMDFVPPVNAVTQLVRRMRIGARARVPGNDWGPTTTGTAVTQYFRKGLINYLPAEFRYLDATGDLANFVQVFAVTLDELKDSVDAFVEIFNIDECEAQYLPYIAQYLGYDLNQSDPINSQRRQLKNAVGWYKVKGTQESFTIMFYGLGYKIKLFELWTQDYLSFVTQLPGSPVIPVADNVPPDDIRLLENGGAWYRSPHFAIELEAVSVPNLTSAGLRYILGRVSKIRPAHTVLEYLRFLVDLEDVVTPIDEYHNIGTITPNDDGWFADYCVIGDPVYRRSGLDFPTPVDPPVTSSYYDDNDLTSLVTTRIDEIVIDFDCAQGAAPAVGVVADDVWSVSWTGTIVPDFSEVYTFRVAVNGSYRLYINGNLIDDEWSAGGLYSNDTVGPVLNAGHRFDFRLDYRTDSATIGPDFAIQVLWSSPSAPAFVDIPFPINDAYPTRDGADAARISLMRFQQPTVCNPPEELLVQGQPVMSETYFIPLRRDGMGLVPESGPFDPDHVDHSTFPWRGMTETVHRDGAYRYLDTLVNIVLGPVEINVNLSGGQSAELDIAVELTDTES
jgi:phage tail-like protein